MDYKGIKPSVLAVMLVAALVMNQGCSIKEDRSRCPCMLVMDFTDVELSGAGITEMQVAGSDGFLYYDDDIFPDLVSEAGDEFVVENAHLGDTPSEATASGDEAQAIGI